MQTVRLVFLCCVLFSGLFSKAQDKSIIHDYIDTYKEMAIAEMQRTGVPASIKLAQGIHETMAGTSVLVRKSNNHFGIKCKATWRGPSVSHDDDARGECFRKYESPDQSYRDHSDFLKNSSRYASLFKLDPMDYEGWAHGLKKAGYATNPKYPQIIIKLVKEYNLQDYTLIALGKAPAQSEQFAGNDKQTEDGMIAQQAVLLTEGEDGQAIANPSTVYPSGEFRINGSKVIYAKKGTSFLAIAQQYDISLAKLFDFNDLDETEELDNDQLVYLERKKKTSSEEFHIVKAGEDIHYIAQLKGIRLDALLENNSLQHDMKLLAGTKIYLNGKAPSRPALSLLAANDGNVNRNEVTMKYSSKPVMHKVKSGETIYSIAKRYKVSMERVMEWNRLRSHNLQVGQELKIYK